MAFDLMVWKWAADPVGVDLKELVEALSEDNPHPAMTRFNLDKFVASLRDEFGEVNEDPDSPFLYDVSDFTGEPANWVSFSINFSQVDTVGPAIVAIAKRQGLAVLDPQTGTML